MSCLYFAFGSNMAEDQMLARCPSAEMVGLARVDGYRLAFVGRSALWGGAVATLRPSTPDDYVWGVLYVMSALDLQTLDRYEGHPTYYSRRRMRVTDAYGYSLRAHVYLLDGPPGMPAPIYYWRIADAYAQLGLDIAMLDAAIAEEETI